MTLLQQPAPHAARQIALGWLQEADLAFSRLGQTDPEALHDFRVAIRRLRSSLRAYRDHLPKPLGSKLRKRFGALMDATNPSRDSEVHLLWLEHTLAHGRLSKAARAGLEAMKVRIAPAHPANGLPPELAAFAALSAEAHRQLLQGASEVDTAPTFAAVNAALLAREAERLRQELADIKGVDDDASAHRARLRAKRLRYVLEPLRGELKGAKAAVKQLKGLQDVLGELHDLHTLEARLLDALDTEAQAWAGSFVAVQRQAPQGSQHSGPTTCYALAAALKVVRAAQAKRYRAFRRSWDEAAAEAFFARLGELTQRLAALEPATAELAGGDA